MRVSHPLSVALPGLVMVVFALALASPSWAAFAPDHFMIAGFPTDSLSDSTWSHAWPAGWPLAPLRANGYEWLRAATNMTSCPELDTTSDWSSLPWEDRFWSCQEFAGRWLQLGEDQGMRLWLMFFFSPHAAYECWDDPPAEWSTLNPEEIAPLLQEYCRTTTQYYLDKGLHIEIYEMGNEIDVGLLGFLPYQRIPTPPGQDQFDPVWLRQAVWPIEAVLLKAAIAGVKEADPDAAIMLHLGAAPYPAAHVLPFFQAMQDFGVDFDLAGLSLYPYTWGESLPTPWEDLAGEWVAGIHGLGYPVVIAEWDYPHGEWTGDPIFFPLPGYPFTDQGQADYARALLRWGLSTPGMVGLTAFHPDYYETLPQDRGWLRYQGLFTNAGGELRPTEALTNWYASFPDVRTGHWAFLQVESSHRAGIVGGYPDGSYRPALQVTRDQMAVYIARAIAGGDDNVPDFTDTPTFPDVPGTFWALKYVEYAVDQAVVTGYDDGKYHPEYEVTRDQMAVYVARAMVAPSGEAGFADYVPSDPRNFPDVPATFWAYRHIEYCVENGVVAGYEDGMYHPEIVVTRDQMAVYVARAFDLPM